MRKTLSILILTAICLCAGAQTIDTTQPRLRHSVTLGIGTGASAPIPIPNRISQMSWTPHLCALAGYNLRYQLAPRYALRTGLQVRHVGMSAEAKVYQMFTQAIVDDAEVSGYFTGYNETKFNATYISLPLTFTYCLGDKWSFDAGLYAALKIQGHFSGAVKDGYIRIDKPTGDKVEVGYEEFDFSDYVNPFDFGLNLSAERRISNTISATLDLSWAFNSCMKSSFRGLEYKMHNIYAIFGLCYKL